MLAALRSRGICLKIGEDGGIPQKIVSGIQEPPRTNAPPVSSGIGIPFERKLP